MIQINNVDNFKNLSQEEHVHLTEIPILKELEDLLNKPKEFTKTDTVNCEECAKDFAENGGCEGEYEPSKKCKTPECESIANDVCSKRKEMGNIEEPFKNSVMKELYEISPKTFDNVNEVDYMIRNSREKFGGLDFGEELKKVLPNDSEIKSIINGILPSGDDIVDALQIKKMLSEVEEPIKGIKSSIDNLFGKVSKIVENITRFNPIKELGISEINIAKIIKEIILFLLGPVIEFLYMFLKVILDILYEIGSTIFGKEAIEWIINTFGSLGFSWLLILGLNSINTFLWVLNQTFAVFYG